MASRFIYILLLFACISPWKNSSGQYYQNSLGSNIAISIEPDEEKNSGKFNVEIHIDHYYPYCGGAYPDESDLNNYSPAANSDFLLYNIETGIKEKVSTNSEGILYLDLTNGKYGLKQMFQDCSFENFLEKNKITNSSDYQQDDLECYRNWWSGYFLEFSVTSIVTRITLAHTFSYACFTGNNPCITYFGPYPP